MDGEADQIDEGTAQIDGRAAQINERTACLIVTQSLSSAVSFERDKEPATIIDQDQNEGAPNIAPLPETKEPLHLPLPEAILPPEYAKPEWKQLERIPEGYIALADRAPEIWGMCGAPNSRKGRLSTD